MKAISRSLVMIFVALIAVPALAVTQTLTTAFQLLATTVLILGGTGHSLGPGDDPNYVKPYLGYAVNNYIDPGGSNTTPTSTNYHVYAVTYPAQFFPVSGTTTFDNSVGQGVSNLGNCLGSQGTSCGTNPDYSSPGDPTPSAPGEPPYVVFGYSQGAVVASLVKNQLINNPNTATALNGTTFLLISNPMRPNGGILARGFQGQTIPIIGITFYGPTENSCGGPTCAPNDPTVYPTTDVAAQYDLLGGDAPAVPWNVLAWANSAAAYYYDHGNMPSQSLTGPGVVNQGQYGDTEYYLITSGRLPILQPLADAGVPDPLLAVVDAPLRVLIESAYYRNTSPGESVGFQLLPQQDLGTLAVDLAESIPVGIDDGLQEAGLGRALGTNNVARPFGVGGETYNKTDGAPEGVETNGVWSDPVQDSQQAQSLQVTSDPQADKGAKPQVDNSLNLVQSNTGNTTATDVTPVKLTNVLGTLPNPLEKIRESLKFDPPNRPSATRPAGDGPLKKIVNALTGQRPTADAAGTDDKTEAKPAA
jgi:PE-PPE domain